MISHTEAQELGELIGVVIETDTTDLARIELLRRARELAAIVISDTAEPQVRQYLDLSTSHVPAPMRDELSAYDGVIAREHPYGYWLWVPNDPDEHAEGYDEYPGEVLTIQRYARGNGCDWINLDADAGTVDSLPLYDE